MDFLLALEEVLSTRFKVLYANLKCCFKVLYTKSNHSDCWEISNSAHCSYLFLIDSHNANMNYG